MYSASPHLHKMFQSHAIPLICILKVQQVSTLFSSLFCSFLLFSSRVTHPPRSSICYLHFVTVIVSLVLLGKYLERKASFGATEAIHKLAELQPLVANVKRNDTFEKVKRGRGDRERRRYHHLCFLSISLFLSFIVLFKRRHQ